MFNITGNLSPPLTILELPFSHRLPRLSSGPNVLSHYVLEGRKKKKKSQEIRESQLLCFSYKARKRFFPFSICRNKMTHTVELLNCSFSGVTSFIHPFYNVCEMLLDICNFALLCWVTSLIPTLIHHYQPGPTQLFCRLRSTKIGWSGDRTVPKITWIKTLPATL